MKLLAVVWPEFGFRSISLHCTIIPYPLFPTLSSNTIFKHWFAHIRSHWFSEWLEASGWVLFICCVHCCCCYGTCLHACWRSSATAVWLFCNVALFRLPSVAHTQSSPTAHQIFHVRPAALSKNRVWTHSLVKLGHNYMNVSACYCTNQIPQVE